MSGLSSDPYTDTYIIECNRQSSLEANGGNDNHTSIFTNKQGQGIKLNAGDKVSIHSAFINEIGNTDGTIEIKGHSIKDSNGKEISYKLTETEDTLSQRCPLDEIAIPNTTAPWTDTPLPDNWYAKNLLETAGAGQEKVQVCQPYGFRQCDSANVEKEFVMRDDEMNFSLNYYKTTNGEGYFHLPRAYDIADGVAQTSGGTAISKAMADTPDELGMPFAPTGQQHKEGTKNAYGATGYYGSGDTRANGMLLPNRPESRVKSEWTTFWFGVGTTRLDVPYPSGTINAGGDERDFSDTNTYPTWNMCNDFTSSHGTLIDDTDTCARRVNDNSKYTIFKKERTFFNPPPDFHGFYPDLWAGSVLDTEVGRGMNEANTGTSRPEPYTNDFVSYNNDSWMNSHTDARLPDVPHPTYQYQIGLNTARRDPAATGNWVPYTEIKKIKLDTGFHSPEDIAGQITSQLTRTDQGEEIYACTGKNTTTAHDGTEVEITATSRAFHQIGIKKDGECFKNFYSANHSNFSQRNCYAYFCRSVARYGNTGNDQANGNPTPSSTGGGGVSNGVPPHADRKCVDYMSAYHYIGVKRPNFFTTGREFAVPNINRSIIDKSQAVYKQYSVATAVPLADVATGEIQTTIPWSERFRLNDFLKSQGEYPELFDYYYTNIAEAGDFKDLIDPHDHPLLDKETGRSYARFVHMDVCNFAYGEYNSNENDMYQFPPARSQFAEFSAESKQKVYLGDDNYCGKRYADWHRHNKTHIPKDSNTNPPSDTSRTHGYYIDPAGNDGSEQYADNTELQPPYYTTGNEVEGSPFDGGQGNGKTDTEDNRRWDMSSNPLWFYYDQSRADLDEGGAVGCSDDLLCLGFAKKWMYNGEECISLTTKKIGGIPWHHYRKNGNPYTDPSSQVAGSYDALLLQHRLIGYDMHFNAYGNASIMLYSGQLNNTGLEGQSAVGGGSASAPLGSNFFYYGSNSGLTGNEREAGQNLSKDTMEPIWQFCNSTLVGANSIICQYDSDGKKRFQFGNLHTPEYIGNIFNAGSSPDMPLNPDANSQVYKINKRLTGADFTPEMTPYQTDQKTSIPASAESSFVVNVSQFNHNFIPWEAIYDAHSGVVFNDFGGTDDNKRFWHKSLWGLLGFSYNQLNKQSYTQDETSGIINIRDRMTIQTRLTPTNIDDSPFIYTNAFVKQGDISVWRKNIYGGSAFTQQTPNQGTIYGTAQWNTTSGISIDNCPAIVINATSMNYNADRQPTKMLRPYFLIKSNIVGDMKYIGSGHHTEGGQLLPIVGVVNKENGFGDYYFQTETKNIFTITQPYTLSEIITSIHDPDMSPARVDNNSAVLYMIQKQNTNNLNVVQDTLAQGGALGREMMAELQPPQMTPAEYTEYFKSFILNQQQEQAMLPKTTDPIPDTQIQLNTDMPRGLPRQRTDVGERDVRPQVVATRQRRGFHQLMSNVSTTGRRPQNFASFQDASRAFHQERARSNLGGEGGGGRILPEGSMRDRTPPQRLGGRTYQPHQQTIPHAEQRAPTQRSEAVSGVSEPRQKM